MSEELFPAEAVTMDSPRLAWMKRHGLCTYHVPELTGECPETGADLKPWTCVSKTQPEHVLFGRYGQGDTEDEACADYAVKFKVSLWNEEAAS